MSSSGLPVESVTLLAPTGGAPDGVGATSPAATQVAARSVGGGGSCWEATGAEAPGTAGTALGSWATVLAGRANATSISAIDHAHAHRLWIDRRRLPRTTRCASCLT